MWICNECTDKKALCHLMCDEFKRKVQESTERQRKIKTAIRAEREMDSFAYEVHVNGRKYDRKLKRMGKSR